MQALSLISLGLVLLVASTLNTLVAQEVKASHFLKAADSPPDSAVTVTSTENKAVGEQVIQAKTKDGKIDEVNAVRAANTQLKNGGKNGVKVISTGSGLGVVAYATAKYSTSGKNPNLIAIEQRFACLEADHQARRKLAEFLRGQSVEGKVSFATSLSQLETDDKALANIEKHAKESYETSINAMIRGVVTFDMDDNPESGRVSMSVVASPRTVGAMQTLGSSTLSVKDLEVGLEFVRSAIDNQIVPPTGGRFIFVQPTGQFAWVAFGSAYWSTNDNADIEAALEESAEKSAETAASAAMIGLLNGEEIARKQTQASDFEKKMKQFDEITGAAAEGAELTKRGAAMFRENLTISRVGSLPPGITSVESAKGRWKLCVKTFIPEITAQAKKFAAAMDANSPLKVKAKQIVDFQQNADGTPKTDKDGKLIPESLGSGQVTNPNDL